MDFLKYVMAVVAAKKESADLIQERLERRSEFLKNVLSMPFTAGIPLIRQLLTGTRKGRRI
ncbi:MAG TPA: hypothetical protein VLY23_18280 [Candidatus Acidoferrum sp.]|nr:hypothetical protein [Candidatus Acidoferrum sp.]